MSAAEEYDELEVDDPEIPPYPGDESTLTEQLDFHLNRIRWYRRKIAAQQDIRDRMIARYEQWFDQTTAGWVRKVTESEAWVEHVIAVTVEQDPDGPKQWRLPSGVVRSNPARPRVEVDDLEAFEEWVTGQESPSVWASWVCHPDKLAVRKAIEETGEVIPGLRLSPGERSVSIRVDVDPEREPF